MNWFWWLLVVTFGLRTLSCLWYSDGSHKPPKTTADSWAYGVLINTLLLIGVLYYGGVI